MGKIVTFFFLLILGALGLFAMENKDAVNIKIPFWANYEISKVAFLILSSTIGALIILMIFFVRDSKKAIDNLKFAKRQKQDEKIQQYYTRGLNAILAQKAEEAKDSLNNILKIAPAHIESLLRLGDIAMKEMNFETALEYYRKSYDLSRSNLQTLLSLADVYEKMELNDDALRYLDEILVLEPDNLTALYRKRFIFEKKQRWDDLLTIQESIINLQRYEKEKKKEQQRHRAYKYEYAKVRLQKGEFDKAEKAFKSLLKMDSGFIPAYIGLADVLSREGEFQAAANLLENAYEELKSIALLLKIEDLLINAGDSSRIIRTFKNAILKNPNDNRLKFLLGRAYSRLDKPHESLEILESLDNDIPSPEFYVLRGELYLELNQNLKALEDLKKASALHKSSQMIYSCLKCGKKSYEWTGICDKCMECNTYSVDINGINKS